MDDITNQLSLATIDTPGENEYDSDFGGPHDYAKIKYILARFTSHSYCKQACSMLDGHDCNLDLLYHAPNHEILAALITCAAKWNGWSERDMWEYYERQMSCL